jgi:hypothetical protein
MRIAREVIMGSPHRNKYHQIPYTIFCGSCADDFHKQLIGSPEKHLASQYQSGVQNKPVEPFRNFKSRAIMTVTFFLNISKMENILLWMEVWSVRVRRHDQFAS